MAIIEGARPRLGAPVSELDAIGAMGGLEVIKASYSFASDGGAVSSINMIAGSFVPSGFVVLGGFIDVVTVPTSGGAATVALALEGAGDVLAATLISGAPWSTTGRKAIIPVFTAPSSVKTTAARNLAAVVAAATLTAGVFDVYLVGFRS